MKNEKGNNIQYDKLDLPRYVKVKGSIESLMEIINKDKIEEDGKNRVLAALLQLIDGNNDKTIEEKQKDIKDAIYNGNVFSHYFSEENKDKAIDILSKTTLLTDEERFIYITNFYMPNDIEFTNIYTNSGKDIDRVAEHYKLNELEQSKNLILGRVMEIAKFYNQYQAEKEKIYNEEMQEDINAEALEGKQSKEETLDVGNKVVEEKFEDEEMLEGESDNMDNSNILGQQEEIIAPTFFGGNEVKPVVEEPVEIIEEDIVSSSVEEPIEESIEDSLGSQSIVDMARKIVDESREKDLTIKQLNEKLENTVKQLNEKLENTIKQDKEKLENTSKQYEEQIANANKQHKEQLAEKDAKIEKQEQEISSNKAKIAVLEKDVQNKDNRIVKLVHQIQFQGERLNEADTEIAKKEKTINVLKEENNGLKNDLNKARTTIKSNNKVFGELHEFLQPSQNNSGNTLKKVA